MSGLNGTRGQAVKTFQSPFGRLLCTNTPPSNAEYEAIRQYLSGLDQTFTALAEEIAQMQLVLGDLEDQSHSLRGSIDVHRAVVSLSRRLPEDVIREIFLACLPTTGNPVMSAREAPLLLGRVCASWRSIAFSTPELWAAIHVVVPNSARLRQISGAVEAWLLRSGVLPLSITVAVSAACELDSDNIATIIDMLTNFSTRWRRIRITLSPRTILTPLTKLQPSDVPLLHSIAFTSIGSGSWQNLVTPLDIPWRTFNFLRTPSIRSASFSSLGGNLLRLPLPWLRLRSLSLTAGSVKAADSYHLTTATALLILRQCPVLRNCAMCVTSDREPLAEVPDTQPHPLYMNHLLDLSIDNREYFHANALSMFKCLRVPSLRRFSYCGPKYHGHLPFISLFSATHTGVESLSIDMNGLTTASFTELLELLPSLVALRLSGGGEYDPWVRPPASSGTGRAHFLATADAILRLLTPAPPSRVATPLAHPLPAPSLHVLEVKGCEPLGDSTVFNLLRSRAETGRPLRRVAISFPRQREFDMVPHVEDLVNEGLKLQLEYLPAPVLPRYSPWEGL